MSAPISIYADAECKTLLDTIEFDAPVEVGTTEELTVYIYNESTYTIANLEYSCDNKFVTFKVAPNVLASHDTHELVIAYTPPLDSRIALSAKINITGNEVIPPTSGILAIVGPR